MVRGIEQNGPRSTSPRSACAPDLPVARSGDRRATARRLGSDRLTEAMAGGSAPSAQMIFRQWPTTTSAARRTSSATRKPAWRRWWTRAGDRRVPGARPLHRRPDRAHPRDPQPRRPRVGPRPAGRGDRRRGSTSTRRRARVRARAVRRRLGAGARQRESARDAHARPPSRAHGVRADRHRAQRRAVGGAHRRLAVRRRRRPARPGRGQGRGRAGDLPLAARAAARPARHVRGVARPSGRLDVRRPGDGHEGLLDDRVRAQHHPLLAVGGRGGLRAAGDRGLGPQPPNFQRIVEINRGPMAVQGARAAHAAAGRRGGSDGALVVDVRTELQFDEAHIPGAVGVSALRAGFGTKLAWWSARQARSCSSGATTRTRGRPPARRGRRHPRLRASCTAA